MLKKIGISLLLVLLAVALVGVYLFNKYQIPPVAERSADASIFRGVSVVGMAVSNLAKSEKFYKTGFGFNGIALNDTHTGDQLAQAEKALLRSTNAQLLLMDFGQKTGQPVPVNGPGIAHVCYQIDKHQQAYQTFLAEGGSHIGDKDMVKLSSLNPVEYAYVHDIDGIMFEVEHVDMAKVPDEHKMGVDRRIRHVSFATPNTDKLLGFYADFLNVEKPRRADGIANERVDKVSGFAGTELTMSWIQLGNLELEFVQYHSHPVELPSEPRPFSALGYNVVVIDVTDVEKATQRLVKAGGSITGQTLSLDGTVVILARDVDGNLLGLASFDENSAFSTAQFKL